jgi:hypothetical protein
MAIVGTGGVSTMTVASFLSRRVYCSHNNEMVFLACRRAAIVYGPESMADRDRGDMPAHMRHENGRDAGGHCKNGHIDGECSRDDLLLFKL